MSLQGVDNVYDLQWAQGVKYREVRFQDEVQQSKYAFGQVDSLTRASSPSSTGMYSRATMTSPSRFSIPVWCFLPSISA